MSSTRFPAVIAALLGVGTVVSIIENSDGPVTPGTIAFAVVMGVVVSAALFALFRASLRRRKR